MEDNRQELSLTAEELVEKERLLAEKEEILEKKETKLKQMETRITNAKHSLYDRVDASLGTMNKVVGGLAIALVVAILAGIMTR